MSFLSGIASTAGNLISSAAGGASSTSGTGDAVGQMTAAFDQAIQESAQITAVTTEKKVELDAAKQRPQD